MYLQSYKQTFTNEGYLNLVSPYKNLIIKNNSGNIVEVSYKGVPMLTLQPFEVYDLENVFCNNQNQGSDENVQLFFKSTVNAIFDIEVINYGV